MRTGLLFPGFLLLAHAGCSAYWPLSEELETAIRKEAAPLEPAIFEDEAVAALAEEVAKGTLAPPEAFALPERPRVKDYVRLALERNPRIHVMVRTLEALGMRVPQVTSLSDPMLTFVPPTGDRVQTAGGEMTTSLGLSQTVPFPAKLAAMGRVAEQVVRIALENLRSTRLAVAADVKKAYYAYYLTSVSIEVTREHQKLLEHLRDVADAKFRAGVAPQENVLRAEVELYKLSNDLLTLEQERRTAVAHLNVLMDRAVEAVLPPPADFAPERVQWELEGLMAQAVEFNPELKAVQKEVLRDLEAARLAALQYLPDFAIGGAYSFISGGISPVATGDDVWNLNLGMTLPVWLHRIRAGILERNAETLASALKYRSRRNDVFFLLQDALVRVDTQYRRAVLFHDAIVPRARQTVEVSETAYQAGDVDFLTLVDNWRRLLDVTLEYHHALSSLEQNFAELEELVGGALPRTLAERKATEDERLEDRE